MNKALEIANKLFGKNNFVIINPGYAYAEKFKIVTFVPLEKSDKIAFAMASAGAGIIGNYTICSFRVKGVGTFKGGKGSKPVVGKTGKYEMAEEIRLEMICNKENLSDVIGEMLKAHPYEEPAYDIYPVFTRNKKTFKHTAGIKLKQKISLKSLIKKLNTGFITKFFSSKYMNIPVSTILIHNGISQIDPYAFIDLKKPFLFININCKKTTINIIEQR